MAWTDQTVSVDTTDDDTVGFTIEETDAATEVAESEAPTYSRLF